MSEINPRRAGWQSHDPVSRVAFGAPSDLWRYHGRLAYILPTLIHLGRCVGGWTSSNSVRARFGKGRSPSQTEVEFSF